jgi:CBS domain-containing protein
MRLDPWWFERAFLAAIVPADFVMARSHLRGLRDRAEGAARPWRTPGRRFRLGATAAREAAMRVREVMSSPVITVSPDKRLKEVAELLVTHGISAVPVVEDGELVGIVSEADLVPSSWLPTRGLTSPHWLTRLSTSHGWPPR